MKIELKEIVPKVFVLIFDTQFELSMSFIRLQEFYECPNPKFKGNYFELEEFMEWYSKEYGNGAFTYISDWNGFNVPGRVMEDWIMKFCVGNDNVREREKALVSKIYNNLKGDVGIKDIYVIGVHRGDGEKEMEEAIEHELAHALYNLYPVYKKSCDKLLSKTSSKKDEAKLLKAGYCKKVLKDELQAYFSTGGESNIKIGGRKEFMDNFEKFKSRSI